MSYRNQDPYGRSYRNGHNQGQAQNHSGGMDLGQSYSNGSGVREPDENTLLNYYQLKTLTPTSWADSTANEFEFQPEDTEDVDKAYGILKHLGSASGHSLRSQIQDEPDPLGYFSSVNEELQKKRIISDPADPQKNTFLVGSKKFNPILFLKHLHDTDSFNTLNKSLDYLEQSIEEESKQLRQLIRNEFLRFVKSKSSLDKVIDQISSSGLITTPEVEEETHKPNPVTTLSENLTLANSKASTIIKPIVDNKKKENNLKNALDIVEKHKFLFDLPNNLITHIENNDYDALSSLYTKGRDLYTKTPAESGTKKILDRVWEEVNAIVDNYKKELWNKLADSDSLNNNYIGTISKLLELGVEDNPIVVWMNTQYNNLKQEIKTEYGKLFENIVASQQHILETLTMTDITYIYYLDDSQEMKKLNKLSYGLVDTPEIIEMWLIVKKLVDDTIVQYSNKIKLYWSTCELFLNKDVQKSLPKGYNNESVIHHKLSDYEKKQIIQNCEELVKILCDNFERFLVSDQQSLTQLSVNNALRNAEQQDNYEIKSPQYYGFVPPYANSLSTIRYLKKFMTEIYLSYNGLGSLNVSAKFLETLRDSYAKILKKFVASICAAWTNDVSFFNTLEDFRITNIKKELSNSNDLIVTNVDEAKKNAIIFHEIDCTLTLSELISVYQMFVIKNIRDILYVDLKVGHDSKVKIFSNPNDKFFQSIQSQFLKNLEILLVSMMKKVTRENKGEKIQNSNDLLTTKTSTLDLYELWTLDNFIELEENTLNNILSYYDETFKTKLSKTSSLELTQSLLPKLQMATFNNYCELKKQTIAQIISSGVQKATWNSTTPKRVSKYVYDSLAYLVILHSTISKVSKNLVYTIIHELQNCITSEMYENLKKIDNYSVGGLQQVAADVEFFKRIFRNPKYKLGKTASANLNLVVLKVIKNRSDPENIINSVDRMVESSLQSALGLYACFHGTP